MSTKEITNDILIIDDEPEVLEVFSGYCKELNYFRRVIIAKDGFEAGVKLKNQNFCLILLDIHMPKKNGIEILHEITASDKNSVKNVILVSGDLNRKYLSEAIELGAKTVLIKPFTKEAFDQKIREVLSKVRPEVLKV